MKSINLLLSALFGSRGRYWPPFLQKSLIAGLVWWWPSLHLGRLVASCTLSPQKSLVAGLVWWWPSLHLGRLVASCTLSPLETRVTMLSAALGRIRHLDGISLLQGRIGDGADGTSWHHSEPAFSTVSCAVSCAATLIVCLVAFTPVVSQCCSACGHRHAWMDGALRQQRLAQPAATPRAVTSHQRVGCSERHSRRRSQAVASPLGSSSCWIRRSTGNGEWSGQWRRQRHGQNGAK
jgi:hypothetical protein